MEKQKLATRLQLTWIALLLFLVKSIHGDIPCTCGRSISNIFLDIASDSIEKAKMNLPACHNFTYKPIDCSDVLLMGNNKTGIYTIWPMTRLIERKPLDVFCDMKTSGGGWTVIQRRGNFGRPVDYFYKDWNSYKEGFGDIEKDFWIGNDNIFALTNQRLYSARFNLQDVEMNKRFALYDNFWIDDEFNNYTLHISGYSGKAGDSMLYHNLQKFTTKDRDNDKDNKSNCADLFYGGWWYKSCFRSNLNGLYRRKFKGVNSGIVWIEWKDESLESTEIMIMPRAFKT